MTDTRTLWPHNPNDRIVFLKGVLQRLAQAEHPTRTAPSSQGITREPRSGSHATGIMEPSS
jgi:hypothetical protein